MTTLGSVSACADDRPAMRRDLPAEVVLDPSIRPSADGRQHRPLEEGPVLLTGATGFLGVYLLHELLTQTAATVACLVRCRNVEEGAARLRAALESKALWHPDFAGRIRPVIGDLSKPMLGRSIGEWTELAERIRAVFHCGASVNFVLPYGMLKQANVGGTHEILRLAATGAGVALHYVSTFGIFLTEEYAGQEVTEGECRKWQGLRYGYVQSKWVAEQLVTRARERGCPVTIYRPSFVGWHSRTGSFSPKIFLCALIQCCLRMGVAPEIDLVVDVAPVDYVVGTIVQLAGRPGVAPFYHLGSPAPASWRNVIAACRALGREVCFVSYDRWRHEFESLRGTELYALAVLLPKTSAELAGSMLESLFADKVPRFVCHQRDAASATGTCPLLDAKLLAPFVGLETAGGSTDTVPDKQGD